MEEFERACYICGHIPCIQRGKETSCWRRAVLQERTQQCSSLHCTYEKKGSCHWTFTTKDINPRCACAARVTVVVLCACLCVWVCVSVRSFLAPCTCRSQRYRYHRVHHNAEKTFITVVFAKILRSEAKASFLLLVHIRNINMRIIHN